MSESSKILSTPIKLSSSNTSLIATSFKLREAMIATSTAGCNERHLYAESVPFPSAKVLFEEIFHSGIIPSDTDFRIFRDHGHKPGLDFAHCKNGYVYHTKYDSQDMILLSVYQHTGDNLLALVRHIVASEQIKRPTEYKGGRQVYFDVGGLFMVQYSEVEGIVLNLLTVLLSFYTVVKNTLLHTAGESVPQIWCCW
ncbi:hypothetical protein J6590_102638 [Homalodisca vitripennis]|nr:hypothetical protein J6590_102638 [Homalodisca vitripennis]